jgi:hypothetical protein
MGGVFSKEEIKGAYKRFVVNLMEREGLWHLDHKWEDYIKVGFEGIGLDGASWVPLD